MIDKDFEELNTRYSKSYKCTIKPFILFIIPTLLYGVIILGYLNIIKFNVEIHSVILIGLIFLIYVNFIKHNAYYSSCKFNQQYPHLKTHLKDFINNNELKIEDTIKANASIDDFLHEFTLSLRNHNFSSIASGIFPTLGILGTFISIAISMPDFSSSSSKDLENEITLLLGGVGTAFYVSIYGIFLSIWWIIFEKLGMSKFEKDILLIKIHTKKFFWNKIDIEKIQFQKSIEHYELLNKAFTNTSAADFENIAHSALESKMKMFEQMIEMEQAIIHKSNEYLQTKLDETNNFTKSYKEVTNNMKELSIYITSITSSLASMAKNMNENDFNINQTSSKLNISIDNLSQSLENISAGNVKIMCDNLIQNIEAMKSNSDIITNNLEKNIDNFDHNIKEKLNNSLEMIDQETSNIISKLSNLK